MGYAGRNSETESAEGKRNPEALDHRRLLFNEVAVLKFSCTRCERESAFAGRALALDICVFAFAQDRSGLHRFA